MVEKRLLAPERARRIPKGNFSWVDQRLLFEGYLARCDPSALSLYLLLVVAGDAQGLSYYSDRKVAELLSLDLHTLELARKTLQRAGLIAYQRPLYQLLSLEEKKTPAARTAGAPQSLADILRAISAK